MANKDALRQFWNKATSEQIEEVATAAETSAQYIYQQLSPHTRRKLNILTAIAIEDATTRINKRTRGRLPKVTVRDLAAMYGYGEATT